MNVAIIENDIVTNIAVVESLEIATSLFTEEVVDADALQIGIGHFRDNNVWYPPKPDPDYVWTDVYKTWVSAEEKIQIDEGTLKILSPQEVDQIISQFKL
jgi:predicted DNA-binding protein with PD1-like motif